MPPTTTVLFDLDGTLIDSIELILQSYRHTLFTHRGEVVPDRVWLEGLGTPLRSQLRAATDDPAEIERMVATYREFNLSHHDDMVHPFPGIHDAVAALKRRGLALGVVTSKARAGMQRGLRVCGFDGVFDAAVSLDDVERHKPDPEPVLKALEMLRSEPSQTVFVGDSPHDMAAGRAARVVTAAALWGPFSRDALQRHAPDRWLESPADVPGLIDQ